MKLRRVSVVFLTAALLSLMLVPASVVFAAEEETAEVPEYSRAEKKEILEEQENVVEELQSGESLTEMSQKEMDRTIRGILEEEYQDAADIGRQKTRDMTASDGQSQAHSAVEKSYEVDDQVSLTFRDRTLQVDILEEGPEKDAAKRPGILARAFDRMIEPSYAAKKKKAGSKKKVGECKTIIYDTLTGWKCFTVYVKAEFTYNKAKKTCTVATLSHYAKKSSPATVLSEVHDKEYLISTESPSSRTCTQSGYIRTGINYKGNGIVTSDYYASASLSCNHKGKITKDHIID